MNQMQKMEISRRNLTEQLDKLLKLTEEEKNQDIKKYEATVENIKNILSILDESLESSVKAPRSGENCCGVEACNTPCWPYVAFATEYTVPFDFEWDTSKLWWDYFLDAGMVVNTEHLKVVPEICYKDGITVSNPCGGEPIEGCKAKIKGLRVLGCIPYAVEVRNLINPANFTNNMSQEWPTAVTPVMPVVSPSHYSCAHVDHLIKYTADCNYEPNIQVELTNFIAYRHTYGPAYEIMVFGVFKISV